ncbi:transposase IS200 family protein [Flavobacterium sp. 90]|uniref:transposase n=1 Tax=unclassified Flavobacterium TaxID=196869 RepID=UPI000EACDD4C|nr:MULTISPECIES: transposase [unclassified Flavobacterium]RKR05492.1 transposase IS200 family protein [Flavobacterium sp. 81]TCK56807.1 transposase IS200 family protein [Flavobacterium sp. 90]
MTLFKDKYKIDSKRLKNWDYSSEAIYFITLVAKNRECIFGSIKNDKMILNESGQIIETELLKSIKIRKNWFFHNWVVMPNHIHLLIEIQNNQIPIIDTDIVEAHSSASPSSISTNENTNIETNIETKIESNIAETHCCAPLRDNWDGIRNENENRLDTVNAYNVDTDIVGSHIVEAHSSASPSSISTNKNTNNGTNIAETHCRAPLHDNCDGIEISNMNRKNENKNGRIENDNQNPLSTTLSRKPNSISSFVAAFKSVTTKQINGIESIWQSNYHDHIVRNHKRFEIIYNYIKTNPRLWEMDSIKL